MGIIPTPATINTCKSLDLWVFFFAYLKSVQENEFCYSGAITVFLQLNRNNKSHSAMN